MRAVISIFILNFLLSVLNINEHKLNKDSLEYLRKHFTGENGFVSYTLQRTIQDTSVQMADIDYFVNPDSLVLINSNQTTSIFYNNWSMVLHHNKKLAIFSKYNPVPDYLFDPLDYTSYIEVSIEYADSVIVNRTDKLIITSAYLIKNGLNIKQIVFYEKAEILDKIEITYSLNGTNVYDTMTFYENESLEAKNFLSTIEYSSDTIILDKRFEEYRYLNMTRLNK